MFEGFISSLRTYLKRLIHFIFISPAYGTRVNREASSVGKSADANSIVLEPVFSAAAENFAVLLK